MQRAQVQRQGGGEDRRCRRQGGGAGVGRRSRYARRQSQEHLSRSPTCASACCSRSGCSPSIASAGTSRRRASTRRRWPLLVDQAQEHDVRPLRHVLGQEPVADDDLRARHHAVHQRVDHPAAADGRVAVPRAAVEGRRARPAQDHAVHALRHDPAERRAGARHRVSSSSERPEIAGGLPLVYSPGWGFRLHDGADADDRHGVHHVAGRADHRARHRQRHVAHHLRRHRRRPAARGDRDARAAADGPDGARPAAAADRADGRGHRRDRLRRARPPAGHRAVRQARRRPPDVRRLEHAHPAEGEHRRRHPGDLRVVDPGVPGDAGADVRRGRRSDGCAADRADRAAACRCYNLLYVVGHHLLLLFLHGDHLQSG